MKCVCKKNFVVNFGSLPIYNCSIEITLNSKWSFQKSNGKTILKRNNVTLWVSNDEFKAYFKAENEVKQYE